MEKVSETMDLVIYLGAKPDIIVKSEQCLPDTNNEDLRKGESIKFNTYKLVYTKHNWGNLKNTVFEFKICSIYLHVWITVTQWISESNGLIYMNLNELIH